VSIESAFTISKFEHSQESRDLLKEFSGTDHESSSRGLALRYLGILTREAEYVDALGDLILETYPIDLNRRRELDELIESLVEIQVPTDTAIRSLQFALENSASLYSERTVVKAAEAFYSLGYQEEAVAAIKIAFKRNFRKGIYRQWASWHWIKWEGSLEAIDSMLAIGLDRDFEQALRVRAFSWYISKCVQHKSALSVKLDTLLNAEGLIDEPAVRIAAAYALSIMGNKEAALPAFLEVARAQAVDSDIRLDALSYLWDLGYEDHVRTILPIIEEEQILVGFSRFQGKTLALVSGLGVHLADRYKVAIELETDPYHVLSLAEDLINTDHWEIVAERCKEYLLEEDPNLEICEMSVNLLLRLKKRGMLSGNFLLKMLIRPYTEKELKFYITERII
jgi:hypothetical protein